MKVTEVERILFNPLFTSRLLLFTLSGANNKRIKLELIYYILPLLYNEQIKIKLSNLNSRSSFKTFLDADIKRILIGIEGILKNYNQKSKEALITLSNLHSIGFSSYITLQSQQNIHYSTEENTQLREYYKAAYNLGNILSKEDYKKIFFSF